MDLLALFLLMALALFVYSSMLGNALVFDDNEVMQSVRDSIEFPPKVKR